MHKTDVGTCQIIVDQIGLYFSDQFPKVFLSYVIRFLRNEIEYDDELLAFMKNG